MSTSSVTFDESANKVQKLSHTNSVFDSWKVGVRYEITQTLGKGSYGQVAKALDRTTSKEVAIKRMKNIFDEPIDAKRAYREMHILRHLKHPSIVALLDVMSPNVTLEVKDNLLESFLGNTGSAIPRNLGDLYLVFEFVDTDLAKIIKSNQFLSLDHVQYMLYQVLDGLRYIHMTNVIHRDLKPANILVSCTDCTIKIADFGLARVVGSELILTHNHLESVDLREIDGMSSPDRAMETVGSDNLSAPPSEEYSDYVSDSSMVSANFFPPPLPLRRGLTRHVVTRWYRAPEVILLQPYAAAVDIWSVGCIFAELLASIKENMFDLQKRKALFPGESCGELSADDLVNFSQQNENDQLFDSFSNSRSQLNIIFNVIGTPNDDDLSHLDKRTAGILRNIPYRQPKGFKDLYPASPEAALDLLQSMLKFNPDYRITAEETLDHPFFSDIKKKPYISAYIHQNHHIMINDDGKPIDEDAALKPNPMNVNIEKIGESEENLKKSIINEVLSYQKRTLNMK